MLKYILKWVRQLYTKLKHVFVKDSIVTMTLPKSSNDNAKDTTPSALNQKPNESIKITKMITDLQLKQIYPQSLAVNRAKYLPYFNKYLPEYKVTTPIRLWSYFAQIGHESAQLRYSKEIASGKAYEGRKDLGNTEPGDGVRFKGRGLIQLTGRNNYQALSNSFGIDFIQEPELLQDPEWAVKSSLWYWKSRNLNTIADSGDFKLLTKRVNGGYNGLADRQAIFDRCKLFIA